MVNFERPRGAPSTTTSDGERRPTVNAVRLKGMLLIDHPEVCELILGKRRVVDIEVALRVHLGRGDPQFSPQLRTRLTWADDHLAVATSGLQGDYDPANHNALVRSIRAAAKRQIDKSYIQLPMQRIITNSQKTETSEDLGSVLDKPDGAEAEAAS